MLQSALALRPDGQRVGTIVGNYVRASPKPLEHKHNFRHVVSGEPTKFSAVYWAKCIPYGFALHAAVLFLVLWLTLGPLVKKLVVTETLP